jgi:hypothetical protein
VIVGLIRARSWEPPDDAPALERVPEWRVPWRTVAWLAGVVVLMLTVPVAERAFGGLAAYAVLLLAVTLGLWRVERFCSRQYWRGLRDYQA